MLKLNQFFSQVTCLGCVLDGSISGDPMALKVINKINRKIKFIYSKNKFLTPKLCRMLCYALIQSYLTRRAQLGKQILSIKQKRRYRLCKINVYSFVLD